MVSVLIFYIIVTTLIYLFSILFFLIGNTVLSKKIVNKNFPNISVIIAIKNGINSIENIINDLKEQDYNGVVEFVLIDDDSIDGTDIYIKNISQTDKRFRCFSSNEGKLDLSHKKKALDVGIENAQYEWLLFTDVDCRLKPTWIAAMSQYMIDKNDYIVGYSEVKQNDLLPTIFQSIDLFMMMVVSRGSINFKFPLACIGQNQAYRKSLYEKIGGFAKIASRLQGDDSLFMQICKKYHKSSVSFAHDKKSFVYARQEKTWLNLFKQRIRWAGDAKIMWKFNKVFFVIFLSTFSIHLFFILGIISSIFNTNLIMIMMYLITIKFILEYLLFYIGKVKFNYKTSFLNFVFWFIFHFPYIVLMGLGSFYSNQLGWKNRS